MESLTKQLYRFINIIQKLELVLLEKNSLKGEPMLKSAGKIPREGSVIIEDQDVVYKIHGGGCTFTYDCGLVIDYDFVSRAGTTINFSPWKFSRFLNTVQTKKKYTQEELLSYLEEMVEEGLLIKNPDGLYFYGVNPNLLK